MNNKLVKTRPKRSLGQNFLTSVGAVNKIIETAKAACDNYSEVRPPNGGRTSRYTVLEVGPGKGVLTEALLKNFDKIIAVEKDDQIYLELSQKFSREIKIQQLRLIHGDILELTPTDLHLEAGRPSYGVVANIPYYITGQFLHSWLETAFPPDFMVLMLQKEVAQRIVAKDGKESLLSISVKTYSSPKYIATIKRGSFYPVPNVDSAILLLNLAKSEVRPPIYNPNKFFEIVRAGFAHKRKILIKNLEEKYDNKEVLKRAFAICGLDSHVRAEELKLEDWHCLVKNL